MAGTVEMVATAAAHPICSQYTYIGGISIICSIPLMEFGIDNEQCIDWSGCERDFTLLDA